MTALAWIGVPAAVMTAGYTAFLFGQAEGRDLWQSPVLFWHLIAQAVMAGGGVLLLVALALQADTQVITWLTWALLIGTAAHLLITAVEFGGKHPTRNAEVAAHAVTSGRYALRFWVGSIGLGLVAAALALGTILTGVVLYAALAGILVQVVLLVHEQVFVRAGQDPPLS